MTVLVCLKWVPRSVVVDPLDATVTADQRSFGPSRADQAALELGLHLGELRGDPVTVACVGEPAADTMLREASAAGAASVVRFDQQGPQLDSAAVAALLATAVGGVEIAVCGDHSLDRGSGATPAFLAAELGLPQILGVSAFHPTVVERRTDRGGRDRISLPDRAVVSVDASLTIDGQAARLRRGHLPAVIEALGAAVDVRRVDAAAATTRITDRRPFRPRPRPVPGPDPTAGPLARIVELTDAVTQRTPPRTLRADPAAAAAAILEQLTAWRYLGDE